MGDTGPDGVTSYWVDQIWVPSLSSSFSWWGVNGAVHFGSLPSRQGRHGNWLFSISSQESWRWRWSSVYFPFHSVLPHHSPAWEMVPFPVEALLKALFEHPHRHTGRLIQVIRNPFMSTTPTNHPTTLHNRATWRAQSPWGSALPSLWKPSSLCLVLFWHPITWTTALNASASPASILGTPQTPIVPLASC